MCTCLIQYSLGRWIGYRFPASSHGSDYQDILINPAAAHYSIHQKSRITAGQAFGQKNTALGVWMAQMYLYHLLALRHILFGKIFLTPTNFGELANLFNQLEE